MARHRPRLTLIEAALLLSLFGVVMAVFVPSFLRRVRTNKIDEASELLAELSRRTGAYYVAHGEDCLPPSAGPTPEVPTMEPSEVDFSAPETPGHETWQALGFGAEHPVRFSYEYSASRSGCGLAASEAPVSIVFRARGDLDGDGVLSTFERRATLDAGRFRPADALRVERRTE